MLNLNKKYVNKIKLKTKKINLLKLWTIFYSDKNFLTTSQIFINMFTVGKPLNYRFIFYTISSINFVKKMRFKKSHVIVDKIIFIKKIK